MPNKTKSAKVSDKQKIENLLNYIHGMQDRLDEKDDVIRRQDDIIRRQDRILEEQRELIAKQEDLIAARRTGNAVSGMIDAERGRHPRRLWQSRRRRP